MRESALLRRVSRRFVVGVSGTALEAGEAEILDAFPPGGFILFRRNVAGRAQVRRLIRELRASVTSPVIVTVDQEGGRVDRLTAYRRPHPSPESLAAKDRAEAGGREIGHALSALGFDLDFAPVVDLRPLDCSAIGFDGRCFGAVPSEVVRHGEAFVRGLHSEGIGSCLKHFPGLGRGRVDSHAALPVVDTSRAELLRTDLVPFAGLHAATTGVMVSHGSFPSLDRSGRPASISPPIVEGLLKRKLGFAGAVFTDDLEMGALGAFGDLPERCRLAFRAGNTFLLVCSRISDFPEAVVAVATDARTPAGAEHLEDAERRDTRLRRKLAALRRKGART